MIRNHIVHRLISRYTLYAFFDSHVKGKRVAGGCCIVMLLMGVSGITKASIGTMVLLVELSPALCLIDPTRKNLRQCVDHYPMTVVGLQYLSNNQVPLVCDSRSSMRLSPLQYKIVSRIMPDRSSQISAWQHFGSCIVRNDNYYFRQIINLSHKVKLPKELSTGKNYIVKKHSFKNVVLALNKSSHTDSIQLQCHQDKTTGKAVLIGMQICFNRRGNYSACPTEYNNNQCPSSFYIQGFNR